MAQEKTAILRNVYWRQYTSNLEPCLLTPLDDVDSMAAGTLSSIARLPHIRIDSGRGELLDIVACAWGQVLSFYCNSQYVCFGIEDRRSRHVSTTLCRINVEPHFLADTVLAKVRKDLNEGAQLAFGHMEELVREAGLKSLDRPCNTAIVNYDINPQGSYRDAGEYDAIVCLTSSGDVYFQYRPSLMSTWTAENVAQSLHDACVSIMDAKTTHLRDVTFVSQADRLLERYGAETGQRQTCVHQDFERQARETPDAEAISSWDGSFTYKDLDMISSCIARQLNDLGVGPEVMVILSFQKTKWHVVASLAVLKAGGACVSIDPTHPSDRLTKIVQSTDAKIAITTPETEHSMREKIPTLLCLTPEFVSGMVKTIGSGCFSSPIVTAQNAAFVVFTSGSTGKPKGIIQEHGAFGWAAMQFRKSIGTAPGHRVLQFASYTFDISIVDTFITLMYGACLCVPSDHERLNDLAGFITKSGVNQACLTPTVARALSPANVPTLRTICLAGEQLTKNNITTWAGKTLLLNAYGPAEVSVAVLCNAKMDETTHPANTGEPIGGQCWIVNRRDCHQLAPIGSVGELLVEGPHLARGYLLDPEKTNAGFVKDLAWSQPAHCPGRRWYRTGDMVRYQQDGSIYFVGRDDVQVKIRGQRVELSDVEFQIQSSGTVSNAVTLYPTSGLMHHSLLGLISFPNISSIALDVGNGLCIADVTKTFDVRDRIHSLESHLSARLPAYMIPVNWIVLSTFPTSTSGKLDRKSLKDWIASVDETTLRLVKGQLSKNDKRRAAPSTDAELRIAKVWGWVLNIPWENISTTDSFLGIGGDSVSAMAVISRCRSEAKMGVTVQQLLQAETLSSLANSVLPVIDEAPLNYSIEELNTPFDLAPIQQMFLSATRATDYSQSFLLRLTRSVTELNVSRAMDRLVQKHSMLRARFQFQESIDCWTQMVLPFEAGVYSLDTWQSDSLDDIIRINHNIKKALDMTNGPVFAANFFDGASQPEQVLFLTAHHMVIDLVSWRVILDDLEKFLSTADGSGDESGRSNQMSFQAWSRLQKEFTRTIRPTPVQIDVNTNSADMGYWGLTTAANTFADVDTLKFTLDESVTSALLGACNGALGTEPLDLLLGVMIHAFSQTFPDRDVLTMHTESHGREPWRQDIDISDVVGWFTTMYPVSLPWRRPRDDDMIETIAGTKDVRRKFPERGFSWFSSQFPGEESSSLKSLGPVECIFNYFGLYQQLERKGALFVPLNDRETQPTEEGGPSTVRMSLLELDVAINSGVLQASLLFNRRTKHSDRLRDWMELSETLFIDVAKRFPTMQRSLTAHDVRALEIDYKDLRRLLQSVQCHAGLAEEQIESVLPCTSTQHDILSSQAKGLGYYETRMLWKAKPKGAETRPMDTSMLERGWQKVVSRHSVLRSIFMDNPLNPGSWLQVVTKDSLPSLMVLEGKDKSLETVLEAAIADAAPNYDLPQPRHRLKLYETVAGLVICQLDISHALIDGAAIQALLQDWMRCCSSTEPQSIPRFETYVEFLRTHDKSAEVDYWKSYTASMKPLDFPLKPSSELGCTARRSRVEKVARIGASDVSRCCEAHHVSPSTIFRAAWAMTLRGHSTLDAVTFGYLANGREVPLAAASNIVGPMIVTLPFHVRIVDGMPVSDVLGKVHEDFLSSLERQTLSWSKIQEVCGLEHGRPFRTLFNYRRAVDLHLDDSAAFSLEEVATYDPMEYAIVAEIEQGVNDTRVLLNYWESDVTASTISQVTKEFQMALDNILQCSI